MAGWPSKSSDVDTYVSHSHAGNDMNIMLYGFISVDIITSFEMTEVQ